MAHTASYEDILDQAPGLRRTLEVVSAANLGDLRGDCPWVFVGCGASYHAATAAAALFSALSPIPAVAAPASEVWMNPDLWLRPGAVVVGLSRTGTTTETVASLATARAAGCATVGVSLAARSELVEQADHAIVLDHVGEQGRVMSRSFSNLLLASQTLSIRIAGAAGGRDEALAAGYAAGLPLLPAAVTEAMSDFNARASKIADRASSHVVFLGSGTDVALCRQAALQMQETARPVVEAHAVLDYRHGPIACLTDETLLVLLSTTRSLPADLILADDVATLGGTLVVVGFPEVTEQFPDHVERVATSQASVPHWLQANMALPFLQLLAYHLTLARGADPESIRNLDRSKTPHVNPHVLSPDLFSATPQV